MNLYKIKQVSVNAFRSKTRIVMFEFEFHVTTDWTVFYLVHSSKLARRGSTGDHSEMLFADFPLYFHKIHLDEENSPKSVTIHVNAMSSAIFPTVKVSFDSSNQNHSFKF